MTMTERERQSEIEKLEARIEELRNAEVEPEVDIRRYDAVEADAGSAIYTRCADGMVCMYEDVVKLVKELKPAQPTLHAGGKARWTGQVRDGDGKVFTFAEAQTVILDCVNDKTYDFVVNTKFGYRWYTQAEFLTPLPDDTEAER